MIEVKDEILSGAPRYRIIDENGNVINNNVSIEMITPLQQRGTPLNKALFDSIENDMNNLASYTEKHLSSDNREEISWSLDTWDKMLKAEEKTFSIGGRRFLLINTKIIENGITLTSGSILTNNIFLLDVTEKKLYPLNNDAEIIKSGADFTNLPNVYSIIQRDSNSWGVGIGFTELNLETKQLKLQTCLYNLSSSTRPNTTQYYSVEISVCELLAYAEV